MQSLTSDVVHLHLTECVLSYFFPYCRDKHWVCFSVVARAMMYVHMNIIRADEGFELDKHVMRRTLDYFLTYNMMHHPEVMWGRFTWEVAGLVNQDDEDNCGFFMNWYMKQWREGHIPEHLQAKYLLPLAPDCKRTKILAEILLLPENKKSSYIRVQTPNWMAKQKDAQNAKNKKKALAQRKQPAQKKGK